MKTVKQLLQAKGHDTYAVTPDTLVLDAIRLMAEKDVGALIVAEADEPLGIFTERDYIRKLVLQNKSSSDTPIKDVMTPRILYVRPEQTVEDCMALMNEKHLRHLPVLHEGRVIGVISIRDVVHDIVSEKQFMIDQLENYIADRR